jgi:hypothetical protein
MPNFTHIKYLNQTLYVAITNYLISSQQKLMFSIGNLETQQINLLAHLFPIAIKLSINTIW